MTTSPALAWRFEVSIDDVSVANFTGCSGLGAHYEVVEWKEGGDNGTIVRLAGRLTYSNVRLTRPVDAHSGQLAAWFSKQSHSPERSNAVIKLYDGNSGSGAPIATWSLTGAWPVQYTGPTLSTSQTGEAVAVETLELAYEEYKQ